MQPATTQLGARSQILSVYYTTTTTGAVAPALKPTRRTATATAQPHNHDDHYDHDQKNDHDEDEDVMRRMTAISSVTIERE